MSNDEEKRVGDSREPPASDRHTSTKEEEDRGQEQGVEDSFPASDPPAANVFD
ncbi:MAG: hypothetical protein NVS2B16_22780 [Chloroflexota bacterium]